MKLFGYYNHLCDPLNNIGFARAYSNASELDTDLYNFLRTVTAREVRLRNWRLFITNDDVTFSEVDHFVLMDEPYGLGIGENKVREIDLAKAWEVAQDDGS